MIVLPLKAGEWSRICASIDHTGYAAPTPRVEPFVVRRADGRPTIIAGYPWFTDWGRDTMISLPGLLIGTGRLDEARAIIEGFLVHSESGRDSQSFSRCRRGARIQHRGRDVVDVPSGSRVAGGRRQSNISARCLLSRRQGNHGLALARHLVRNRRRSRRSSAARRQRRNAAHLDGREGRRLGGYAASWKAVEINALWHGALCLTALWADEVGDPAAGDYREEAERVRESFRANFWNRVARLPLRR